MTRALAVEFAQEQELLMLLNQMLATVKRDVRRIAQCGSDVQALRAGVLASALQRKATCFLWAVMWCPGSKLAALTVARAIGGRSFVLLHRQDHSKAVEIWDTHSKNLPCHRAMVPGSAVCSSP